MSQKKDMRRPDLVIPYQTPVEKDKSGDLTATLATTMPMAAMFTRNKFVGWASVVFAVQAWLSESKDASNKNTPGILSVGMSLMALVITYLPLFLPPPPIPVSTGTGTGAPAAAPLS